MSGFDPAVVAESCGGTWYADALPSRLTGFSQDTRRLQKGDCFVALVTDSRDGHDFLEAAKEAGASSVLVSQPFSNFSLPQLCVPDTLIAFQKIARYHRQAFSGKVIGVTGSCGKTTTKELTATLLGEGVLKTEGNLNNFIGVPLTLTRLDQSTHHFGVVEAGINEPGEMDTLAQMIEADVAICTMVGEAHLEKLGSVEGVAREKSRLGELARPGAPMLFPAQCLRYPEFRRFGARAWVAAPPGSDLPEGNFNRLNYKTEPNEEGGCRLKIESAALVPGIYDLPVSSPGLVSDAVLAITATRLCGISEKDIQVRLKQWKLGKHRGDWINLGQCLIYDDCYNANPSSIAEALAAFVSRSANEQSRLFILGGMKELGDESQALHEKVGRNLPVREEDRVVFIGNEAEGYLTGLKASGFPVSSVEVFATALDAVDSVKNFCGSVFLKGSRAYALEQLLECFSEEKEVSC
ncbi:UDP-N-acetylmuramoyl-tripeptide--D-alanyl-D-alanine ligase [Rubellicoccus peritrichatus]|uniref:UDP-N-acetylmuramoyl-tripeptide--D-alanyl-D-alanine ligase n=1 Tax=Rubellicoccus peritrichatus TaxID=3080537 RepID=A0AAQ3QXC7_9BACT|nr:UDP-N-acetylmuramoyl-tripeptide--D-alanyl-D-alanine ligase [Puniceicoccus sp. CR14]WOO43548.1 UDP-N-acetylmuramoyl-tripeptide--D-alanyl-D-alanine ligase [Puniceicoccus sp. CR14]